MTVGITSSVTGINTETNLKSLCTLYHQRAIFEYGWDTYIVSFLGFDIGPEMRPKNNL